MGPLYSLYCKSTFGLYTVDSHLHVHHDHHLKYLDL